MDGGGYWSCRETGDLDALLVPDWVVGTRQILGGLGSEIGEAGIEPCDAIASCQWARLTLDLEPGGGLWGGCQRISWRLGPRHIEHRAGEYDCFRHRKQNTVLISTFG